MSVGIDCDLWIINRELQDVRPIFQVQAVTFDCVSVRLEKVTRSVKPD